MIIRVIYNETTKLIIAVVPAENTTTYTSHSTIQDTSDNCIIAMQALNIDTAPITNFLNN